ncbi:MAG: hypothetical protein KC656_33300 [Myxococcales bacterium]|nr:hypothetical protein [Myxococcales bacterium]
MPLFQSVGFEIRSDRTPGLAVPTMATLLVEPTLVFSPEEKAAGGTWGVRFEVATLTDEGTSDFLFHLMWQELVMGDEGPVALTRTELEVDPSELAAGSGDPMGLAWQSLLTMKVQRSILDVDPATVETVYFSIPSRFGAGTAVPPLVGAAGFRVPTPAIFGIRSVKARVDAIRVDMIVAEPSGAAEIIHSATVREAFELPPDYPRLTFP